MSRVRLIRSCGLSPSSSWERWFSAIPALRSVVRETGEPLLRHWARGGDFAKLYRPLEQDKAAGGKRKLWSPRPDLKSLQSSIYETVLKQADVHPACHGFRPGRSIFTNARIHQGQEMLATHDIEDCFPSISAGRVYGIFRMLGSAELAAAFLTDVCVREGWLPAGVPTSPALLNLICRRLDARLHGLMRAYGGEYSRYCDDMAISGPADILNARPLFAEIVAAEGFRLSLKKSRVQPKGHRQKLAGVVVNEGPSVPRRYRRMVRAAVHWASTGKQPAWNGRPISLSSLRGRIGFVAMTHPAEGQRLFATLSAVGRLR